MSTDTATAAERATRNTLPFRYTAALAGAIERRWQDRWEHEGTFHAPNPAGPWAAPMPAGEKVYLLDMFPYPSGHGPARRAPAGLHRHRRAGPLPADDRPQRAAHHGLRRVRPARRAVRRADRHAPARAPPRRTSPGTRRSCAGWAWRTTSAARSPPPTSSSTAGPSGSSCRSTTPGTTRSSGAARPIAELEAEFAAGTRPTPDGRRVGRADRRPSSAGCIDSHRLAYISEAPVNWCPGLGTVLANEEVTADGRSERGNFPVFRRNLKQWMMRITAYADRLVDDLDRLDWPESVKAMQRNWIGRSEGAQVRFPVVGDDRDRGLHHPPGHPVRRHLHGAGARAPAGRRDRPGRVAGRTSTSAGPAARATPAEAVAELPRARRPRKSDLDRQENKDKTGVFTGAYAINPVNGSAIPVFVADYVLMGYGTGAIMAVPGQDQRDWDFATTFGLPIIRTVQPPDGLRRRGVHRRRARRSTRANAEISLNGLGVAEAKRAIIDWLVGTRRGRGARCSTSCATGCSPGSATGASRSRSSGTTTARRSRCRTTSCRSSCPRSTTTRRRTFDPDDADTEPEPPLSRATEWVDVELDLGDGLEALPPRDQHDAAVGRLVLVLPALPGPGRTTSGSSTRRSSSTGWARTRRRPGRPRRRRPVRRRRRARGAAPAVRAVLAQGAVRPGPRQLARSRSGGCSTRATSRPTPTPTPAASTCRPRRSSRRAGRWFHVERRSPSRREYGKMGKSLKQRGDPGRDVRALRRRHLPAVRDVDGPDGRLPAVVDPRRRRLAAVPAAGVAQPGRRADRRAAGLRRRAGRARRCARCTGRSTACTPTSRRCTTTRRPRS